MNYPQRSRWGIWCRLEAKRGMTAPEVETKLKVRSNKGGQTAARGSHVAR